MTNGVESIRIDPIKGTLDADVLLPGSKSLTNRALVIAALARGTTVLSGVGLSDDTEAMLDALVALGAAVSIQGTTVTIDSSDGLSQPADTLDARMSGTTARFLLPLVAVVGGGEVTGHAQMRGRPMKELVDALRALGVSIDGDALPLVVSGRLDASAVSIASEVTSQFISSLLLSAPAYPNGLDLHLVGATVSMPYIDMTVGIMRAFGATIDARPDRILVSGGGYSARDYAIEPDASTASYPLAAAALVGGRVTILGLGSASLQGDAQFATRVLEPMGVSVYVDPHQIEVRGSGVLDAVEVDLADMSDTAPTFAVLAAKAAGTSSARGIGFIRDGKESDRVGNPVRELSRVGISATVDADGFSVTGGSHHHAELETYDDHRMAMSLALLGLVETPVTILDPGCSAKTFPAYWEMIDFLRSTTRSMPRVLAIDGPAGSGKSTVAKLVSKRLRLPHLDTGAMYRSVTLAVLRSGVAIEDHAAVAGAAKNVSIVVGPTTVTIDDEDVTAAIRDPEVTAAVSAVAANPGVRHVLAEAQRSWARARGAAVLEGRDIGTAVFPDATLKVYLNASVEERARRRAEETGAADLAEMELAITKRDHLDMTRETDPLTIADDAVVIDSTSMAIDDVVDAIIQTWEDTDGR